VGALLFDIFFSCPISLWLCLFKLPPILSFTWVVLLIFGPKNCSLFPLIFGFSFCWFNFVLRSLVGQSFKNFVFCSTVFFYGRLLACWRGIGCTLSPLSNRNTWFLPRFFLPCWRQSLSGRGFVNKPEQSVFAPVADYHCVSPSLAAPPPVSLSPRTIVMGTPCPRTGSHFWSSEPFVLSVSFIGDHSYCDGHTPFISGFFCPYCPCRSRHQDLLPPPFFFDKILMFCFPIIFRGPPAWEAVCPDFAR